MSVATAMYSLKPVLDKNVTINRDRCMYSMKNIHCERVGAEHASMNGNFIVTDVTEKNPLPDVAVLEARQEKILVQLAELKEQVLSLCDVLKVGGKTEDASHGKVPKSEAKHEAVERREPVVVEVVVKADPSKPCYAVQALPKIWTDVDFEVACFTHSSVSETAPEIKVERKQRFTDSVKLSLIWKKVEDLEVVISGVQGYPLIGETNLLRYLIRRLSAGANEEFSSPQALSDVDYIFDLSHCLNYQDSRKDIRWMIWKIAAKLGKRNFLGSGDEAGIADVAAWSAIKRASIVELPSHLVPWFDRCDNFFN